MKTFHYILPLLLFPFIFLYPQWHWQNPLPFGDPIQDVFFEDENHGWMAPDNTTLYKTTNGGANWNIIYTDILFEDVFFINADKGWGIGRTNPYAGKNSIYHTLDGGKSWEVQLADTSVRYEIFFLDENVGWATGEANGPILSISYLFETKNGGLTWQIGGINALRPGDNGLSKDIHFVNGTKGWLVGGLIWGASTIDGGKNWERDSSLANIEKIVSGDTNHLWGLSNWDFIVRTTNGGETWNEFTIIDTSAEVRARDIYAVDENNIYISTNVGFFGSIDGGMNFTLLSNEVMNSISFTSSLMAWGGGVTSYSGLYHSTDGGNNWEDLIQTNNEFENDWYYAVDFIDENTGWIVGEQLGPGTDGFILKTMNGGKNWDTQYFIPDVDLNDIHFSTNNLGFAVGGNELILKTTDGGSNWITKRSIAGNMLNRVTFINEYNGWVVGGDLNGGLILKTTTGGESWVDVTPALGLANCYGIAFTDSLTGWVAAGTGSSDGIIIKTSDGGNSWMIQRQSFGMYFDAMDFVNADSGWAVGYDPGTDSDIIFTSDGGVTWTGQIKVFSALHDIKFVNSSTGWAAGRTGIYRTINGGLQWSKQETYSTQRLKGIDFIDENVGWAIGNYGTILYTDNGGTTSINEIPIIENYPKSITLYPNYPNPFNPTTKINFDIPTSSDVTLKVFDVLGREIKSLVNEFKSAGSYEVDFDASNLPSGIYFYTLQTKGFVQSKKMVLLK